MPTLRTSSTYPITQTSIGLSVDGLTYQPSTYYAINMYDSCGNYLADMRTNGGGSSGAYYTAAKNFTVFCGSSMQPGTSYSFECRIKYTSASAITYVYGTFTTLSPPAPGGISGLSVSPLYNNISASWNAATNATSYDWGIRNSSGSLVANSNTTSTSGTFGGNILAENTYYTFTVQGRNSSGLGTAASAGTTTKESTAPSISITSCSFGGTGNATLTINWSASDNSALSRFDIYISGQDQINTQYYYKAQVGSSLRTASYTTDGNGLSFIDGYTYYVRIDAYDQWGNSRSAYGNASRPSLPPPAPGTPSVTGITYKDATVSWTAATGATHYKVQLKRSYESTWMETILTGTSTSYNGLSSSTTYNVQVVSLKSDGYGGYVTGGTSGQTNFTTAVDPIPQNVTASTNSTSPETKIDISWSAVSGATTYKVENITTGGITTTTATTYTWSSLSAGSQYGFRVYALVSNVYGSASNAAYAWTRPLTPANAPLLNTNYGDNGRGDGGFYVNINSVTGANSYIIRASTGGYPYATVNTTSTTAVWLGGLSYGTSFSLDYNATNNGGTSGWSPTQTATTLPQTITLEGSAVGGSTLRVQYQSPPSGGWSDIEIERYPSDGSTLLDYRYISNGGNTYVDYTGLTPGTAYRFKCRTRYLVNSVYLYSYSYSGWLTLTTAARPTDWKWTTAIDANGNKVVSSIFSMTAVEWTAFQNRINDFRGFKGLSPYTFYASYNGPNSFVTAVKDANFYHYHMNQAINAINQMIPTGLSQKSSGDIITAADLNTLKNKLNAVN